MDTFLFVVGVNDVDNVRRDGLQTGAQERRIERDVFQRHEWMPLEIYRQVAFAPEKRSLIAQRRVGRQLHQEVEANLVIRSWTVFKEILGQPQQAIDFHLDPQ